MGPGDIVDVIERGPQSTDTWEKVEILEDWGTWALIKRMGQKYLVPKRHLRERRKP